MSLRLLCGGCNRREGEREREERRERDREREKKRERRERVAHYQYECVLI
jgi:hypothetical protein